MLIFSHSLGSESGEEKEGLPHFRPLPSSPQTCAHRFVTSTRLTCIHLLPVWPEGPTDGQLWNSVPYSTIGMLGVLKAFTVPRK